jgi:outer membrane protein assembly factor BamC
MRRVAFAIAAALVLGGCTTVSEIFGGKKIDYKSAGTLPPLEVPPDLTAPSRENRYAVPEAPRSTTTLSGYEAERTQQRVKLGQSAVLPQIEDLSVQRAGTQRWLVVKEPPEKLWELVKEFWQENGFLINIERPEAGVMETDWAENRAKIPQDFIRRTLGRVVEGLYSVPERDKFRTRLERAPDGTGTEVYISHRGMMEVYIDERRSGTTWQPRPSDPELEAEFLRRLMVRLGAQEERAKQLVANAPVDVRAKLATGSGGAEMLEVYEPFDRAWRRVGLALDRVGFTVEDRDRQKGIYFVRYADPEAEIQGQKKEGFLASLAFWRSNDPKVKAEQYRVRVEPAQDNSRVEVLDKDGAVVSNKTSQRILALLHEQLK